MSLESLIASFLTVRLNHERFADLIVGRFIASASCIFGGFAKADVTAFANHHLYVSLFIFICDADRTP